MAEKRKFRKDLEKELPRGLRNSEGRGVRAFWLEPRDMTGGNWRRSENELMPKAIMLGRDLDNANTVVGWSDDKHMLTVAGSRAGKGVSFIVPNLLSYAGSALVIDPKGELAAVTRNRRIGMGQQVHVLDPFGASKLKPEELASFNPLAEIDVNSDDAIEDAALCAEALIIPPDRGERHWSESAQQILQAIILMVLNEPLERRNLLTVRDLLMGRDAKLKELMDARKTVRPAKTALAALIELLRQQAPKEVGALSIKEHEEPDKIAAKLSHVADPAKPNPHGHVCAGIAEWLSDMGDQERGSILSSAKTQTKWLDSPAIGRTLKGGFRLGELKSAPRGATIYLCLPATRMAVYHRWLRLIISLGLTVMERDERKPELPVLFVLDEFPVLGHVQSIESALGQMAGFGVKLWVIVQNVGQVNKHYGDGGFDLMVGNSGVVIAFGNNDTGTLEALSKMLGRTAVDEVQSSDVNLRSIREGASLDAKRRESVPLLAEHELRLALGRSKGRALILTAETEPAVVERFVYYADTGDDQMMFKGQYDQHGSGP